jgi:hypothetical protein
LPRDLEHISLRGLRVGRATVDLRFATGAEGKVSVDVLRKDGELEVVVEG